MLIKMTQVTVTVKEAFSEFIDSKRANGIKEKTLQTYQGHFNSIGRFLPVEKEIGELSKKDIEQAILEMKQIGCGNNSLRSYTATMQSFMSWCKAEGYSELTVKLYKGEETIKDTYTTQELEKLLAKPNKKTCTFPEYRNWVIINLLLNSGCRASTIRNILNQDVNLDDGLIKYRHTKNGLQQMVPLCQEMRKILKEYMKVRQGQPNDYLFPNQVDQQITEYGLSEAIRRYNRSRGVTKTSIHLFRHSYAERYLKAGGNAFNLQRILGHTTLTMTRHYCRVYDADIVKDYDNFSPLQTLKSN